MDAEHALQKRVLRELQAALAAADEDAARALMQRLEDVTEAHFLGEQLLMRRHAYPAYQAHVKEHDELVAELRQLGRSIRAGEPADPARQAELLERWLVTHVETEDQALAEYLKGGERPAEG